MTPDATMSAPSTNARLFAGGGRALSLAEHLDIYGPFPDRSLDVREIERAGLRGRGGAGFPTATKIRAVAAGRGPKVLVANGAEGEPASTKDVALLSASPHLVLDGVVAAAGAVGATNAILCVSRGAGAAASAVDRALAERSDRVRIRVARLPDRYVAGEESALIHWLNGGDAKPTLVPPRPFQRGVGGKPTLVQNVETLACIALIVRSGAARFASVGDAEEPGTRLITVSGAVQRPGVYEVPCGITLGHALEAAGGRRDAMKAVLTGGYFGTWLPATKAWDLPLTHAGMKKGGASLGCGVVVAVPDGACGIREIARVARYLAAENARQCGPCMFGLDAIAREVGALADGRVKSGAAERITRWSSQVQGRGACHHPDGAIRFVQTGLRVFADETDRHRAGRPCASPAPTLPIPAVHAGMWR